MPYRQDPNTLRDQGNGTRIDNKSNLYNDQGYLIQKSAQQLQEEAAAQQEIEDYRKWEHGLWKNAINKAGGIGYVPKFHISLGFVGWFFIGFFVLGFINGFALFLDSPVGREMIYDIGNFFARVLFHIKAFLFAWPQTFTQMFKHWFYLPELLLGIYLVYYLLKTADDQDFYREDGFKCMIPYLAIEGIRALFTKGYEFTKLACILRGLGLGIGLCIIVKIARRILIRH